MIKLDTLPPILTMDEKKQIYENWTDENQKILVERNIRWAIKIACSFQNTGIEYEELECISMLGLAKAVKKFNPQSETEFCTYATQVIRNEILMEIRRRKKFKFNTSLNSIVEFSNGSNCELGELVPNKFNLEDYALSLELEMVVHKLLEKEKPSNKRIIENYLNGIKQCENARICGVSQSLVSKRIKRFRDSVMKEWMR